MSCPQLLHKKSTIFEAADDDAAPLILPHMPSPIADGDLPMHGDLRFDIGTVQTICATWLIKVPVKEWATPTLKEIDALHVAVFRRHVKE